MAVSQQRLFGTNGVRFVPGVSHDLDFVIALSEALGTYFGEGEVLLGQDGRNSSPAVANATVAGLMSSGRDVAEAGVVPTPALQYAVKTLGFKGGVMVTASHNPPEYNGLKVMGPEGVEIPRLDEQRIEKVFFDGAQTRADWKSVGVARQEPSVVRNYLKGVLSKVNAKSISERKFTVVMDLGNGAQCAAAPYLVEALGCKLITLNSILDGNFLGRGPEPTPDALKDLSLAVRSVGADLGVAYDGDGDRSIFCDEDGRILWGDQSGCLIADYLLEKNPDSTVVTPVSSGQAIDVVAKKRGGKVIRTKVGSVEVSRTMLERKALFGFEENGGCIYSPHIPVRDGAMTTALMLECLAARGVAFSRAVSFSVSKFFQAKMKIEIEKKKVGAVMRAVERQAKGEVERIDGLKILTDEHSWVLVRPSGTEPIIRIFTESQSQEKADALTKRFAKVIKAASA
ncbi:MAG: phosphoglucosamine mutase [Nitrososphaerales archaeon]|nr:phosphoglucosamine mutase [Nitrososphaerales archaeon]